MDAMPNKHRPLAELGSVVEHHGGHCAHLQFRSDVGTKDHIRGPDRLDKARAEADLAQIRAAGAVGKIYYSSTLCEHTFHSWTSVELTSYQ